MISKGKTENKKKDVMGHPIDAKNGIGFLSNFFI
jgi:hypothetical protein